LNFFAHAVAATWRSERPAFVLGAMLPDFAHMARATLANRQPPGVEAGVAYHHLCDRHFHRMASFRRLESAALALFRAAGLSRGPARGAAHVGVELCLDGACLDDSRLVGHYRAALHCATPAEATAWIDDDHRDRFLGLRARLEAAGAPTDYTSASGLAMRIEQVLSRRPLLRLSESERPALLGSLPALQEQVAAMRERLFDDLRAAL
jgi:hypothetical protein